VDPTTQMLDLEAICGLMMQQAQHAPNYSKMAVTDCVMKEC
jgi:hypothetical protein